MKVGQTFEFAMWADGTESPEMVVQLYADIQQAVAMEADRTRMIMAPIVFTVKRPGDERVPPVPKHIHGPDVRLIIAEARVIGERTIKVNSFLGDLDKVDLERLRLVTRRAYRHVNTDGSLKVITDEECDRMIEELGPQAAYETVKAMVDGRTVH